MFHCTRHERASYTSFNIFGAPARSCLVLMNLLNKNKNTAVCVVKVFIKTLYPDWLLAKRCWKHEDKSVLILL